MLVGMVMEVAVREGGGSVKTEHCVASAGAVSDHNNKLAKP